GKVPGLLKGHPMLTARQAAGLLLDTGAARISRRHPFLHASGLVSPVGVDTLMLSARPAELGAVLDGLAAQIAANAELPDVIAGADTASIFLAARLAERLGRPMVYLRPKPKDHGQQKR